MGMFLILLTFIADTQSMPDQYKNAADTSRRALMADKKNQEDISQVTKRTEHWMDQHTGLRKEELVYFAYASPIVTKSISTKPFGGIKHSFKSGFVVRPEITYSWKPGEPEHMKALLVLTREF